MFFSLFISLDEPLAVLELDKHKCSDGSLLFLVRVREDNFDQERMRVLRFYETNRGSHGEPENQGSDTELTI